MEKLIDIYKLKLEAVDEMIDIYRKESNDNSFPLLRLYTKQECYMIIISDLERELKNNKP